MRRQAVVNANVTFRLRIEGDDGEFTEEDFCYPKGIEDYVFEKVGADYLTEPFFIEADRRGRDREDLPDYNVKITACLCFSRTFPGIAGSATTRRGSKTAARPRRRPAAPSPARSTPTSRAKASTTKTRAPSNGRMSRTAWYW